jgi:hypothetical protein
MGSTAAIVVIALICFAAPPASSKDSPKIYQTGKLLDLQVQNVSRGVAVIGSMAAPIPGLLYAFQIQCDDLVYFATYSAGKLSYKPDWIVNDPIDFRLDKGAMFLKRPDGKELEVRIVKKVRVTKDDKSTSATDH